MRAVAEAQRPAIGGGARGHVGDDAGNDLLPVGPHQEHVRLLRRRIARRRRQTAEIQQRGLARRHADARWIDLQLPERAVMIERLPIQQRLQYPHRLDRAGIARARCQRLAGQVGRNDVDRQPPAQHPVDRRDLPRQLRRPAFADPHRHQQRHPPQHRRDRGGKGGGVDPQRIARRQQDIVEPAAFGLQHDVAAMLPARLQLGVGHAQKLVIVVAQRREPADFARGARRHGSFSPRDATSTSYQSCRLQRTL